jgi:small subunit ribosomal protein S1
MKTGPTNQDEKDEMVKTVTVTPDGVRTRRVRKAQVTYRGDAIPDAKLAEIEAIVPVVTEPPKPVVTKPTPKETEAPTPTRVIMDESFEDLLKQGSGAEPEPSFEPGTKVSGVVEIISLQGEEIFLDLGGKATGYVMKSEFRDDTGELTVNQGDVIEGVVAGIDTHGVRIRTSVGRGAADRQALDDAFHGGLAVRGKVLGANKGGFSVEVAGTQAFCPMSQIDLFRPPEPEAYVGQEFTFKITDLRQGEPILSRLNWLKEQRESKAKETLANLEPGQRINGVVQSIQKFGVFVDIGGLEGLVHMSELAWGRTEDASQVVSLGQEVEVVVLDIDSKGERISLSMRRASADPFSQAMEGLQVGEVVSGLVARLTTFGAFVTLAPNVDGLIHVSDMAHFRVRHPSDVLSVGDTVRVKVGGIDLEQRRISLSLKALAEDPWDGVSLKYPLGKTVKGKVEKIADFGVFVALEEGVTALIPGSETGMGRERSLHGSFRVGQEVEARVLRVEEVNRRIALTLREDAEFAAEAGAKGRGKGRSKGSKGQGGRPGLAWTDDKSESSEKDEAVGSLGALLLAALDKEED